MRSVEKVVKFIVLTGVMLVFLGVADLLAIAFIKWGSEAGKSYLSAGAVASELDKTQDSAGSAVYILSQKGQQLIDMHNGFAFLMDTDGDVVWSYRMPDELPLHYGLTDVVRFTRYYLKDYPVYTHIMEDGVLVAGTEKFKTWKYTLILGIDAIDIFPAMLIINFAALLFVPFFVIWRDARKKEQERTTWIAGVSHDIRTPLALALGYADEIVRMAGQNAAAQCNHDNGSTAVCGNTGANTDKAALQEIRVKAQAIERQAVRIRTLVANLNMENKLAFGMGNWQREKILLPALIRETICDIMNRNPADCYDIRVIISENSEQLIVKGDRELIRRALENLINNAVGHNPQGCSIEVRLTRFDFHVYVRFVLEVSDNGCGVSREQLKRFRSRIRRGRLPEHGLGIRLVRQIAAFHHWSVRFSNRKGGGFRCVFAGR